MSELEMPIFSNTCGKLFADRVVFASANRETAIPLQNIRSVSFYNRPKISSLIFMLIPLSILIFPMFIHDEEPFLKGLFFIMGLGLLVVSVIKIQKKYTIHLQMQDGSKRNIKVWEGNRKEAQKFVEKAMQKCARKNKMR